MAPQPWKEEHQAALFSAIQKHGKKWKLIVQELPDGITEAAARNFYLRLQKKEEKKARDQLPGFASEDYADAMQALEAERKEGLRKAKTVLRDTKKRIDKLWNELDAVETRLLDLLSPSHGGSALKPLPSTAPPLSF